MAVAVIYSSAEAWSVLSRAVTHHVPLRLVGTSHCTRSALEEGAANHQSGAPDDDDLFARMNHFEVPTDVAEGAIEAIAFLERTGRYGEWQAHFSQSVARRNLEEHADTVPEADRESLLRDLAPQPALAVASAYVDYKAGANKREMLAAQNLVGAEKPRHRSKNLKTLTARAELFAPDLASEYRQAIEDIYDLDPQLFDGGMFETDPERVYTLAQIYALPQPGNRDLVDKLTEGDRARILSTLSFCNFAKMPQAFVRSSWKVFLLLRDPIDPANEKLGWGDPGFLLKDFVTSGVGEPLKERIMSWIRDHCEVQNQEWGTLLNDDDALTTLSDEAHDAVFDGVAKLLKAEHTTEHLHRQIGALSHLSFGRNRSFAQRVADPASNLDPLQVIEDLFAVRTAFGDHWVEDPDARRHGADPNVRPSGAGATAGVAQIIGELVVTGDRATARTALERAYDALKDQDGFEKSTLTRHLAHLCFSDDAVQDAEKFKHTLLRVMARPDMISDGALSVFEESAVGVRDQDRSRMMEALEDKATFDALATLESGSAESVLRWMIINRKYHDFDDQWLDRSRAFFRGAADRELLAPRADSETHNLSILTARLILELDAEEVDMGLWHRDLDRLYKAQPELFAARDDSILEILRANRN